MFESLSDETMLIAVDIIIIMTISALLGYTAYRILRNPFRYPYFVYTFDVSYKRNVDITDYVDGFLCDERNWDMLIAHQRNIIDWKETTEDYLASCVLKKHRTKQYREILDDQRAFQFETVRGQTRYRQRNYIRSSYRVPVSDKRLVANWQWLLQRHYGTRQLYVQTLWEVYARGGRAPHRSHHPHRERRQNRSIESAGALLKMQRAQRIPRLATHPGGRISVPDFRA